MRTIRIAFVVPDARSTNSHGRYATSLAAEFVRQHEVHIVTGCRSNVQLPSVRYHLVPVVQRPTITRLATLWAAVALCIRKRSFDIVHTQGADALVCNVVTAQFCHSAKAERVPPRTLYERFNSFIGGWAEPFVYRRAALTIAVSKSTRDDLIRYYHVPEERIRVVYSGVDIGAFHPEDREALRRRTRELLHVQKGDFVVLYVGGDYRRKGLPQLIEGIGSLRDNVKLLVLGCREDAFLRHLLTQRHLGGRVFFRGPADDVVPYYAASDCFVLPTLYDTFGLVVLEAMASELPVIVSAAAGASELIEDGVNGFVLHDPTRVASLAERIGLLAENSEMANRMGQLAHEVAREQSWASVAQRTMQTYQELL